MAEGGQKYYGKYRGTVINNIDPMHLGRIQVQVAEVTGLIPESWAMPCVPIAGTQAGIFIVPPLLSNVWVEFEHGDPRHPIWVGGFWGSIADVPILELAPPAVPPGQNIVIQPSPVTALVLSDSVPTPVSGGIVLKSGLSMIVVNSTGVYITNGTASITMIGPTVTVNMGALVVI